MGTASSDIPLMWALDEWRNVCRLVMPSTGALVGMHEWRCEEPSDVFQSRRKDGSSPPVGIQTLL